MNDNRVRAGTRVLEMMAAGLAAGALALTVPTGPAAADPNSGPGITDPVVHDYLDRVNALVDQFNGENPSGRISAEDFNSILNVENQRLLDALIATRLPR